MVSVNAGEQNKFRPGSVFNYSFFGCFALVLLLGLVVLDAFEYIAVPGLGGSKGAAHAAIESAADIEILSNEEIAEMQREIAAAKKALEEKTKEVEKLVERVEEEVHREDKEERGKGDKPDTAEEKKEEEEKKEAVVEAVVEKELGIDKFCGQCQFGFMPFSCNKRLSWMMSSYGLTEDIAKKAILNKCHYRRLRG